MKPFRTSGTWDTLEFYPYAVKLENRVQYLIWYEGEVDGVLLEEIASDSDETSDAELVAPTFATLSELIGYAGRHHISLCSEDDPRPLDLDRIRGWLGTLDSAAVECSSFLDAWNLFEDLASNVRGKRVYLGLGRDDRAYYKLLYGCNLPVFTPPGKKFVPEWTRQEIKRMARVFVSGLRELQSLMEPA
jgi:hypothetical protein